MPTSRIQKTMDVLCPVAVITRKDLLEKVKEFTETGALVFCLEEIDKPTSIEEEAVLAQRTGSCDTDLLYVLFTSGSTGMPKGVTICHQSVMDYSV